MLKEHDAETSEMPADSIDGTDDVRKNPMRTVYDWVETLCSALALMLVTTDIECILSRAQGRRYSGYRGRDRRQQGV